MKKLLILVFCLTATKYSVAAMEHQAASKDYLQIIITTLTGYPSEQDAIYRINGQRIGYACKLQDLSGKKTSYVILSEPYRLADLWIVSQREGIAFHLSAVKAMPYSLEDIFGRKISCHTPWMSGSALGIEEQIEFVRQNPCKHLTYRWGLSKLSPRDKVRVSTAERIVNSIERKESYSELDMLAVYIAFEMIRSVFPNPSSV